MSTEDMAIIRTVPALLRRHMDELSQMEATAARLRAAGHEWAGTVGGALANIVFDDALAAIEKALPTD